MRQSDAVAYADRLLAAHGARAEAQAAQKAEIAARQDNINEAEDWQQVRDAIRQLRATRGDFL